MDAVYWALLLDVLLLKKKYAVIIQSHFKKIAIGKLVDKIISNEVAQGGMSERTGDLDVKA